MILAIAQMNVVSGRPDLNVAAMLSVIERYRDQADLIIFSEMAVGGYFLSDRYTDTEWLRALMDYDQVLLDASRDTAVIWGNVYLDPEQRGHDGRIARYNAVRFAVDGQWATRPSGFAPGLSVKHLLPAYRVFDDPRYFRSPLPDLHYLEPFHVTLKAAQRVIGLQVCEDLWSDDYDVNPSQIQMDRGAELIVNVSASPWTRNKEQSRHRLINRRFANSKQTVDFVYVNASGIQNNGKNVLLFDGGSSYYRQGRLLVSANDRFREEVCLVDTDQTYAPLWDEPDEHKLYEALVMGIRLFDQQQFAFHPKWIIGLSGGIDSSVNAALLCKALGKDRIIGVNMATHYNRSLSIQNAEMSAQALGIRYLPGSILPLVEATHSVMQSYGYPTMPALVQENIQARVRGHLLSTIAAAEGGVILNNANKVETALGYTTLYGDTIGALASLADLTKLEVVTIGRLINQDLGPVIPENLLAKIREDAIEWTFAPSAELREGQSDPMKWGYHDALIQYLTEYPGYRLEALLKMKLDGSIMTHPLGKYLRFYGLEDNQAFLSDLHWVLKQMQTSVFKRIQMPPIMVVSRGAFGFDYRETQGPFDFSLAFKRLEAALLAQ